MKILDKNIDYSLDGGENLIDLNIYNKDSWGKDGDIRVLNFYDKDKNPKDKDCYLAFLPVKNGKIIGCYSLACNTKYVAEFLNYVGISKDSIDIKHSKQIEFFSGLVWDKDGKFYSVYDKLPKDKKYETGNFQLDKTYHEIPDFSNVHVKGDFFVTSKRLSSLKGAPSKVDGDFVCTMNNLQSLEGAPEFVGGNFSCSFNRLTSLENGPKKVGGYYTCCYNPKLKNDKCSTKVGKEFLCDYGMTDDVEKMDFYRTANRLCEFKTYDCEYSNRKVKHTLDFLKDFNFPGEAYIFSKYKRKIVLNRKVDNGNFVFVGLKGVDDER